MFYVAHFLKQLNVLNVLNVKTIVNSMYFMWCKLSRKWNAAILNLKR